MMPPHPLTPELLAELEAYYAGTLSTEAISHLRARIAGDKNLSAAAAQWEAVLRHGLLTPDPEVLTQRQRLRAFLNKLEQQQPAAPK